MIGFNFHEVTDFKCKGKVVITYPLMKEKKHHFLLNAYFRQASHFQTGYCIKTGNKKKQPHHM